MELFSLVKTEFSEINLKESNKLKLSFCLIKSVRCYEEVWENGVNGQLHAPAILSPEKEPPVPIG
jgi:hypothetical protein